MARARWLRAGPVLAAAALLAAACSDGGASSAPAREAARPAGTPVAAVEVAARDLSRRVMLAGTLEPLRVSRVSSQTATRVTEVRVEEGDRVAEGDVLAILDVAEQRAELERARALLEDARARFERDRELYRRRLVAEADFRAREAELRVAAADTRLWETRVGFGTVHANLDGVLIVRAVEPGDGVAANQRLFELADLSTLVLRVGVSELDAVHLVPGAEAKVTADAVPGGIVDARVRRLFPSADAASRLVTVEVVLDAASTPAALRPGFLARVELLIDPRPDVLAVPSHVLGEGPDGVPYVFLIDDRRLVRRRVTPGISRRGWTEITGGLAPGDAVLAVNPMTFAEGHHVRIVQWSAPAVGG
jgi:membrane fusion protein, multidrug efflux system